VTKFSPPSNVKDFDEAPELYDEWNNIMQNIFKENIEAVVNDLKITEKDLRVFNPTSKNIPEGQSLVASIQWNGFPLALRVWSGEKKAYQVADEPVTFGGRDDSGRLTSSKYSDPELKNKIKLQYRQQDEYLEWVTIRNEQNKIIEIIFTCEGPEYWKTIATNKDLLVNMYSKYTGQEVNVNELYFTTDVYNENGQQTANKGSYNPHNKLNLQYAIHLCHPSNSLGAEVRLAIDASILRKKNSREITDANELICCARFGSPNRSSDPQIGFKVNTFVRDQDWVSLSNPVGLYIAGIDGKSFTKPDNTPIPEFNAKYWNIIRGEENKILRARLKVPEDENFVLGDMFVEGKELKYGGQVANIISMGLYALIIKSQEPPELPKSLECECECIPNDERPDFLEIHCPKHQSRNELSNR